MQVLLLILLLCTAMNRFSLALNEEGLVLGQVKSSLYDPEGFLSDWSDGDENPCNWTGVKCDGHGSVVEVVLSGASLAGPFPESVCRLPSLRKLVLSGNGLNSTLPLSVSSCRNLTELDLSQNFFVGPMPSSLADLHFLRHLNLEGNNFSGDIPSSFGRFQRLETLNLLENLLNGTIPAFLGNISSLKFLWIGYNPYSSGTIPSELGNLTNLEELWLAQSSLIGTVPYSLGRLSNLKNLDLSMNWLTGSIPTLIFKLHNVKQIELYQNNFSGSLPPNGWSNLTKTLRRFDASDNDLKGMIPKELCDLPFESLNLYHNQLVGVIPTNIANSPNLRELKLFGNKLSGSLPRELGKNSGLAILDVSYNKLTGNVSEFLCANGVLEFLILLSNEFSGTIPDYLGDCTSLRRIRMNGNKLYGEVPAKFWGLPHVNLLDLYNNSLSGNISSMIRSAQNLSRLIISSNKLSGSIPSEIGQLKNLVEFSAKGNWLTGEIPSTIVNLDQLGKLDVSDNDLSGEIPEGIHYLKQMNELNLANNKLCGEIPREIGNLPVLNYLDLSQNNFSGVVPLSLQNLKLNKLNMSNNHFSGDLPPLFSNAFYRDSFLGNPGLCFPDSNSCIPKSNQRRRSASWLIASIFIIPSILLCLVGIFWLAWMCRKVKKGSKRIEIAKWKSFHKLDFSEFEIGESLTEANVIGKGSSGRVYKVSLSNGQIVAVKKLHEGSYKGPSDNNLKGGLAYSSDEYEAEVETLGTIRHKNIVRLWCSYNSGNCKLLVYEYMPNGSLGDLLHGNKRELLDWPTRLKIASDAAEGLSYLHHDSVPSIVHRDVKSNNILLDEDFGAKLSDFGVAKVVKSKKSFEPMSAIAGSCGYIAPEYAYTLCVNEKSDIYSFGVVVLELVTGKPPTGDVGFGGRDLASWARTTLDQSGAHCHVFDPSLDSRFHESISRVLDIGLMCTNSLPVNRPSMRRVVGMLQELVADVSSRLLAKNFTVDF